MADVTVKYKDSTIAEMSGKGTKILETSGKYCEGDITINYVPSVSGGVEEANYKSYDITVAKASGWVELITLDSDVLTHINDESFTVLLAITDAYAYEFYSGDLFVCSNTPYGMQSTYPVYGYANRQQNETTGGSANAIYYPANYTGTDTSMGGNGAFRYEDSKYYIKPGDGFIRGGTYKLIFTW